MKLENDFQNKTEEPAMKRKRQGMKRKIEVILNLYVFRSEWGKLRLGHPDSQS